CLTRASLVTRRSPPTKQLPRVLVRCVRAPPGSMRSRSTHSWTSSRVRPRWVRPSSKGRSLLPAYWMAGSSMSPLGATSCSPTPTDHRPPQLTKGDMTMRVPMTEYLFIDLDTERWVCRVCDHDLG